MQWKLNLLAGLFCAVLLGMFLFLSPMTAATSGIQDDPLVPQPPAMETAPVQPPAQLEVPALNIVKGVIENRTLYEALTACDIPPSDVLALSRSFKPVFDFRCSRPKDAYQACIDDRNQIQKFLYKTGPLDEYEAIKKDDGGYRVHKREIAMDTKVVSTVFTIETSLYQAVADSGETQLMAGMIADIFAWDIDFYLYPRKNDRIAVVYERCVKDGQLIKYGRILAARYEGERKNFSAFLFNDGQFDGYFDENGQPLKKMFLRTPVKFGKMTSAYSIRRFHPISKRYKAHTGIDYGAPTGTAIFATANGRVTFSGWKSGYGKLLIIKHPNGYQTYYGHCSRLLKKPGQLVEQGQVVARVGQTGVATGPHVHYEVRINGKPVNPNTVKKSRVSPLKPERMAAFKKTIRERMRVVNHVLEEKTNLVMQPGESDALDSARKKT
ncbi:peptidase M24 [Desulfosarcina ovata subsp. sediminis]|uniref:Peptidase M24 n=1 Tax=Desulfosarcina ovata subsp. sediminis TaxID=885957 RepID=A0A5K7ZTG8_9BACT|nr:M23 family metallopeptidase [Desulfosarcina ovata]BBO83490.1 peptidase M24 [Desulfosarcina ovata subsp. sediminis]